MFLEAYQYKYKTNIHLSRIPYLIPRSAVGSRLCKRASGFPTLFPHSQELRDTYEETFGLVPGTKNIVLAGAHEKRTDFLNETYSFAQSILKTCFKNQNTQKVAKCGLHKALSL